VKQVYYMEVLKDCVKKLDGNDPNFFTLPFQYFQIVNLFDSLSIWYKFIMNNPSNIQKSQQHCF